MSTLEETSQPTYQPSSIDKGPPTPAPTQAYSFRDYQPKLAISYIRTLDQAKTALASLPKSGSLGFDLEWRPTFKKGAPENPVALVQLANNDSILLFQVSYMREFPLELKQILESSQIVKAGVGIQGDAKKLFKDWKVSMSNCVDLSLLARTVDNARWTGLYNSPIGLARLIQCYEYRLLLKGKLSRSDWTAALNLKQQEYAGNDAHAGYTLYNKLEAMVSLMPSQPRAAWYSFHVRDGILCSDDGHFWVAANPDYDPGPLPEHQPPTEAQLERKKKRAEARQASSTRHDGPYPRSLPIIHSVLRTQTGLTALNPMPTWIPSHLTTNQVSGYHHFAGQQTATRNNSQHQLALTNGHIIPQRNELQSFPSSGKDRRYAPPTSEPPTARTQPGNNPYFHRFNARDNVGPSIPSRP